MRGFLSGTLFLQDATFGPGNGQQSEFVSEERDDWWHGGDVRNARVALQFAGDRIAGSWRPGATIEIDFFGPFNGTGNFTDEQPLPRLRLAYVDLASGGTRIRVGQDWSLTWGNVPTSVSHLGFPLGWGSGGLIGWRAPGVWLRQRFTAEGAATAVALQLAVMRGSWSDEAAPDAPSAGERGIPQLEARLDLGGSPRTDPWNAYVVGHYDRKDFDGPAAEDIDGWALEEGASISPGPLTLQGNGYVGRAMGHQFAHVIQFGDIGGWGAWGQAGLDLSDLWSVWGYFGIDDPDDEDVRDADATRLRSWTAVPMIRLHSGPYTLGLEWLHNSTDYVAANVNEERRGNQLLLSVRYDF